MLNAGDGTHEHPTQALLDLYTMREKLGRLEGLRVAIVGDVLHSRVARSLSFGLVKMGAEVTLIGPPTLIPPDAPQWGVNVSYDIESVAAQAGRLLHAPRPAGAPAPRVLPERARVQPDLRAHERRARRCSPRSALIMHPGPMNRGVEIDSDVADLPQARDRGTGHERHRDPDVAALPLARWRRRGGPRWLSGHPVRRRARGRSVDRAATSSPTCSSPARRSRRSGTRARRRRRRDDRLRGPDPRARASWTCTRTCASRGSSTRRRSRPGRGRRRRAGTRRSRRWRTRSRSPTTPASWPRSATRPPPRACADVFPVGAITKGLAGESIAEMGEMVEAGVRVFSDDGNCVPIGAHAAQRPRSTRRRSPAEVVIADHCEDPSLVEGGQMHEGVELVLARAGRAARRGRGDRSSRATSRWRG